MVARRARLTRVPHIYPHQYRHTWAHQYRKSGGDRGDLKRLGGWKSDQMVDRVRGQRCRRTRAAGRSAEERTIKRLLTLVAVLVD